MVLAGHSNAVELIKTRAHSHAGAHFFLSEDDPMPRHYGPILNIDNIIKFVMSSATEAKLAAMFITAEKLVPLRESLVEMHCPQPPLYLQNKNSRSVGITDNTIVPRQTKSTDIQFYCLRCRAAQDQFRFYCPPMGINWGDYSTKHCPSLFHKSRQHTHDG